MVRIFLIIVAFLGTINALQAQQEAHYTQYMYNKNYVNAGYAGARRVHSVYALYRNQWMGFNGNPHSYLLSYDGPVGKRLGAGVQLANQELGVTKDQFANLMLSYAILQTENTTVRVGISGTMRRYAFNLSSPNVFIQDPADLSLKMSDQTPKNYFNVGTGVYFDYKNLYVGLSVPNLNKNLIGIGVNPAAQTPAEEQRHVYLMAGGLFKVKEGIELKPSVMLKYVKQAPFSADLNLSAVFKRKFTAGASYRYGQSGGFGDSADLLAFFQATDKLGIGVAYDFTLSGLRQHTSGTVEALIRYDFSPNLREQVKNKSKDADPRRLSNPRYFF
jgi:type IX secretion system PorP/SprF family membrane protein